MAANPRRSNRPRAADFTTPLTIPGGEMAGAEIVGELAPEVALAVWQTLRSVLMWAGEEPALRGDLFEPCAMGDWERQLLQETWDPDVRSPLAVLVGELAKPAASAETVAHACLCVTDWALERGHVATALAFAEAAALSWPQHARFSWLAGRLLRRHGRLREAEMWLKRASRAAVTAADWEAQALALNSLGNGHYEVGDHRAAIRTLGDALRVARKHRLRQLEGEILHDLFAVTMWSGDLDRAEPLALAVMEIYQSSHHRLAPLAHDVAVLWIKRRKFTRALAVLRELPALFPAPEERVRVLASLARAAGECGEADTFGVAAREVRSLARDPDVARRAAPAVLEVGLGAWAVGEIETAEEALEEAIRLGGLCGEQDVVTVAETALQAVRAKNDHPLHRAHAKHRRTAEDPMISAFVSRLRSASPVSALAS